LAIQRASGELRRRSCNILQAESGAPIYFEVVMEDEKFQTPITAFETKTTGALEFESTFGCRSRPFRLTPP
jgi:hypothetical protein